MFKIYRRVLVNPGHPEQIGKVFSIETYGALHSTDKLWWRKDDFSRVEYDANYCKEFYAKYGVTIEHVIAVYNGRTAEYVNV